MNPDGSIYHFDPSNPPEDYTSQLPPSPIKKAPSQRKSPMKDSSTSPKRSLRSRMSLAKPRSLISSSTSPNPAPIENTSNMPIQSYTSADYAGGFITPGVGTHNGTEVMYQSQVGVVYQPYVPPPTQHYDNRPVSIYITVFRCF